MATPAEIKISQLDELARRVDKALERVRQQPADVQKPALELKDAIEAFHKLGLTKIIQTLKEDPRGKELLFELVDDQSVYALFQMHGLVREDISVQVTHVLDMVRPYMQSHGGDVELVRATPDTIYIKLSGSCNGCSMSSVTLRNTVEEAIHEHLPQIEHIEVVPNEPEPAKENSSAGFVPLTSVAGVPKLDHGWAAGPAAGDVQEAVPFRWDTDDASILVVRFHGELKAYRNECAHLGMPLDGGSMDPETGVLTCPWHGFRFDCASGECLTVPEAQLEGLPLRVDNGRIVVRVGQ